MIERLAGTDINGAEIQWLNDQFDGHYCKRAWVHFSVGAGIEEGEFAEARESMGALQREVAAWTRSGQMLDYPPYASPRRMRL